MRKCTVYKRPKHVWQCMRFVFYVTNTFNRAPKAREHFWVIKSATNDFRLKKVPLEKSTVPLYDGGVGGGGLTSWQKLNLCHRVHFCHEPYGGRGRAWSESPGRKPEQDLQRTRGESSVCPGPALATSTMRSDVTRSVRATSSLHLPHLVDHLAVSALARRALRSRRPRASPLALFSFPPTLSTGEPSAAP